MLQSSRVRSIRTSMGLALVVVASLLAGQGMGGAAAQSRASAPTSIYDCVGLQAMRNNLSAHYVLANDIDCSSTPAWNGGRGFEPVGSYYGAFTGTFEGRGHTVGGLYINRPDGYGVGLFGATGHDAEIMDVHLVGIDITGEQQVGGLVGGNQGTISGSLSAGSVSGTMGEVGGLVGYSTGSIYDSHSSASVQGGGFEIHSAGGLIGENRGLVQRSYASGNVSGENRIGGLVGANISGTVSQCFATGTVTGGNGKCGGLVGSNQYNNALIVDSYATATVIGGTGAYAAAGGLLGVNGGTGWGTEAVGNCYSVGKVSGDDAGGLVGDGWNLNGDDTITDSYWDEQASGVTVSGGGIGKLTYQMMQQYTFAGWDFAGVWSIREDRIYPWHKWQTFGNSHLVTCQASGNQSFYWQSSDWGVVRECTLTVPANGLVYISADATLARSTGPYEAHFRIGIDSLAGDSNVDRWVSVYDGGPGGKYNNLALSTLKPLGPGTHTIYLLVQRHLGTDPVLVWDSTLSAIFLPTPTGADLLACEASGNSTWETTSTSYEVMRQCTLDLPSHGWVYISADGTADTGSSDYEGQFRLGIDDLAGEYRTDRWLNVYDDPGGDTDTTLTLAGLLPAPAGRRTFYLLGRRSGGTGTVRIYDSTLNVLFIPAPSFTAASCGVVQSGSWTSTYSTFRPIRQCTLDVPAGSWVFISANATVNWNADEARGQFEIGIDTTTSGDWNMDRWIDTYPDSEDGSDDGLALTMLRQVPAGTHTFYLLGRHDIGPGSVDVYDASLTVLALGAREVYLPMVLRAY